MLCSVPNCYTELELTSRGVAVCFYPFPSNQRLRQLWIDICKIPASVDISQAWVCSKHFRAKDFEREPVLHKGAVPSLKLPGDLVKDDFVSTPVHSKDIDNPVDMLAIENVNGEPSNVEVQSKEFLDNDSPLDHILDIKDEEVEFTETKIFAEETPCPLPKNLIENLRANMERKLFRDDSVLDLESIESSTTKILVEPGPLFKCTICGHSTTSAEHLERHLTTHTVIKPFQCTICDYSAARSADLKLHMKRHSEERPFVCTICDYSTVRSVYLKVHMSKHTGLRPFKCPICDYSTAEAGKLKRHKSTHQKPLKCTICDTTVRLGDLKNHIRKHTGVNVEFKCTICEYSSAQSAGLKIHIQMHSVENPFECTMCDYLTWIPGNLKKHTSTQHNELKPFKCTICEYSSSKRGRLKRHEITHTSEKPFKCTICDFSSAYSGNLKVHLRKHSGEKPFKCMVCDYSSARSGHLKRHMSKHT